MRILFKADLTTPNAYYRALVPLTCLSNNGHQVRQVTESSDSRFFETFDLLHIHRYADADTIAFARLARRRGLAVVWDNDDNFAAITRDMPAYKTFGGLNWEKRRNDMRRIFEVVDMVSSPSAHLTGVHGDLGAQMSVTVPNRLPERSLMRPQTRANRVLIGWVAGGEHRFDVRQSEIDTVLAQLLDENPRLHVETIGLSLGLRSPRYEHVPSVHFQRLTERLSRCDIGIAPLADLPLNHSRSDVKVREYASSGAAWLASSLGPYQGYGKAQGGLLVESDGWYEHLSRLSTDPKGLKKLSKAARKWAAAETIEKRFNTWEQLFQSALVNRRGA